MPPEVTPQVAPPSGGGPEATHWLERHGIIPVVPSIRSSDLAILGQCRRRYFLERRLGLTKIMSWSKAKSRGSWAHKRFEVVTADPAVVRGHMNRAIELRCEELRAACAHLGLGAEKALDLIAQEKQDFGTAWAWMEEALALKVPTAPDLASGLAAHLKRYKFLAQECRVKMHDPLYPKVPLVGTLDGLVYEEAAKRVWILDPKTTDMDTISRLQLCRCEFQTRHYLYIVGNIFNEVIRPHFKLPADVQFGGMKHIAIQKPSIVFGQRDRHYHWFADGKRTGIEGRAIMVAKGWAVNLYPVMPEHPHFTFNTEAEAVAYLHEHTGKKPEKQYTGEPDPGMFRKRVADWYAGRGDYVDEALTRTAKPCVNISTTFVSLLDAPTLERYHQQLAWLYKYATCQPIPNHFDDNSDGMLNYQSLSHFAPFYQTDPRDWPEVILREGFVQHHRDAEQPALLLERLP